MNHCPYCGHPIEAIGITPEQHGKNSPPCGHLLRVDTRPYNFDPNTGQEISEPEPGPSDPMPPG